MDEISSQLANQDPGFWLAISLSIAILATNAAWVLRLRGETPDSRTIAPLVWLGRSLFFLLPPFLALRAGAISPALLGLGPIDWVRSLMAGALAALAVAAITVLGWLVYRRTVSAGAGPEPGQPGIWHIPIDAALLQWHWAFYRACAIGLLAAGVPTGAPEVSREILAGIAGQSLYWGTWAGLLALGLEWGLDPFARRALGLSQHARERTVVRVVLAIATGALFAISGNFWIGLACHVAVEAALGVLHPGRNRYPTSGRAPAENTSAGEQKGRPSVWKTAFASRKRALLHEAEDHP